MSNKVYKIFSVLVILFVLRFGEGKDSFIVSQAWNQILPQGWGFFTINPYYSRLHHFKISDDKSDYHLIDLSSSSFEMLFGLNRSNRRKSLAFNYIYKSPVTWSSDLNFNNYENLESIRFSDYDCYLGEGIYFTIKEETINIYKIGLIRPRKAMYMYEIK